MAPQRIAVIGGVAAGPAAAAQAKRTDPDADVVLFEQGEFISYGACEMPYYIADEYQDAGTLLVLTPEEFEKTRHATVRLRHQVLAIHPKRDRIDIKDVTTGVVREERFDKIILAVGARPRMPEIEGVEALNIFPLRRLDDAIAIKAFLENHPVQHAVVMGGGYIGVEMAESLRERGVRVTILEPFGGLLNKYLDPEMQPFVHEEVAAHGVHIRKEKAEQVEQDADGLVRAVKTDKGEKIGCQLVIVAMGLVPNTDLAKAAGIHIGETGALAVDDQMRTNLPSVWACGDCVEVERVIDRKQVYLPLSPVAYRSGHVAGQNAARRGRGTAARFPGVCMASAVQVFGLEVAAVGLRLEEARKAGFDAVAVQIKGWSRVKIYPGSKPIHIRYVVERKSGRLLGAELIGQEGAALRADVLVPCIREGWTVDAIKDLDLIYAPPLAPSIDPLLRAAHAATKKVGRKG
ncbi:MAG TPA: FAD-dependent oxidoreductase [Rhodothermales bacterium]|nr:FAD-dependent oxidoreductase [Rhodothermales bacterium]